MPSKGIQNKAAWVEQRGESWRVRWREAGRNRSKSFGKGRDGKREAGLAMLLAPPSVTAP